jgi:hypothetical protein
MSSKPYVIDFKDNLFDIKNVVIGEVQKNKDGKQSVYVNYKNPVNGKLEKITIKTPDMRTPFGFSEFKFNDKKTGKDIISYTLNLSFDDHEDTDSPVSKFYNAMLDIDNLIKAKAVEKFVDWLPGKEQKVKSEKLTDENAKLQTRKICVDGAYSSHIKDGFNKKTGQVYAPTLNMKLQQDKNGEFSVGCFDSARNKFPVREIGKNSLVRALISAGSVYFLEGFGITWYYENMVVSPKVSVGSDALFDTPVPVTTSSSTPTTASSSKSNSATVDDRTD